MIFCFTIILRRFALEIFPAILIPFTKYLSSLLGRKLIQNIYIPMNELNVEVCLSFNLFLFLKEGFMISFVKLSLYFEKLNCLWNWNILDYFCEGINSLLRTFYTYQCHLVLKK